MKKSYKLSFGTIKLLATNLAEIIVNEGIILNEIMVDECHDFLLSFLEAPFNLLINKTNSYSYTYGAQQIIADLKEINATAVIVWTSASLLATDTLLSVNNHKNLNIKVFRIRDEAISWLKNTPL
ncbi:hypothetical protein PW52_01365 [Tamlana sedimentorum]|uniref:STAS/SEC14 domain-containing protein n=1 Tax=Neotamlana sedimentorum TaxID=1435349 RepID=A0A0D7WEK4_9FLAO|nr:hypothetical protein [Tamlana sedimentorum]KJD37133.1 hypothetical protein PW52_01365 [Tamlana sedimentorum]